MPMDGDIEIELRNKIRITLNEKPYFHNAHSKKRKNEQYFQLNSALKLHIFKETSNLKFEIVRDKNTLFSDLLEALDFMDDLTQYKCFKIDDHLVDFSESIKSDFDTIDDTIDRVLLRKTKQILDLFRVNIERLNLEQLNDAFDLISLFIHAFLDKKELSPQSGSSNNPKAILEMHQFLGRKILVIFSKTVNNTYKAYNFHDGNIAHAIHIVRGESRVPVSRYLAIACAQGFSDKFIDNCEILEGYFPEIKEDLIDYYDPKNTTLSRMYNDFMLKCVHAYDKTKNEGFLVLASELNEYLNKKETRKNRKNSRILYWINKLQVVIRKRPLDKKEKKRLVNMKKRESDNTNICGILILLGSFSEFEVQFEQLSKEVQENFRTWPIWGLYENRGAVTNPALSHSPPNPYLKSNPNQVADRALQNT